MLKHVFGKIKKIQEFPNLAGLSAFFGISGISQLRAITFSKNGLKMFIGNDYTDGTQTYDHIWEFNLVCPFNIISGKCPSITENSDKTGMAEAQIELARRTIERSTNSTLNRLKWIRRNKDKQNLTNLNINLNFSNQILASLTEVVRTSAAKKNTKDKNKMYFIGVKEVLRLEEWVILVFHHQKRLKLTL